MLDLAPVSSESFQNFYREQWGERWAGLDQSLRQAETQVARRNHFADVSVEGLRPFGPEFAHCFEPNDSLRRELPRGSEGLLGFYLMDPASVWIARALNVQPDDVVLDLCAAPGGKSLCLIEALASGSGEILANEPSPGRRERLMKVIQQYVPRDVRERVRVTGKEGGLFSKSHPETFDRILVDAPCSGERHLLENQKEMTVWSPSRSKRLAQEQYALLSGALEALKLGGTIVYSTCALSHLENDAVLEKFLKKKGDRADVTELPLPDGAERTRYGVQFLPDRLGYGPLFAAQIVKR